MQIENSHFSRRGVLRCLGGALALSFFAPIIPAGAALRREADGLANPASRGSGGRVIQEPDDGLVPRNLNFNGRTIHYLIAGSGPAVVLIHGFPQDSYEFHQVMARLAKRFTVIAPDLRGVGGSSAPAGGYDVASMAEDISQLSHQLKLAKVYLVGHDIGGMVAYAYSRLYPADVTGVLILDVPIPGIDPWEKLKHNPIVWHFGFHQTPDLPEELISRREFIYLRSFFDRFMVNRSAISDDEVQRYARSYSKPEQLKAGLGFYRAFSSDETFNRARRTTIEIPFVIAAGDKGFGPLLGEIAEGLRKQGCTRVTTEVIENSGHFVVNEQPEKVSELIERWATVTPIAAIASDPRRT